VLELFKTEGSVNFFTAHQNEAGFLKANADCTYFNNSLVTLKTCLIGLWKGKD